MSRDEWLLMELGRLQRHMESMATGLAAIEHRLTVLEGRQDPAGDPVTGALALIKAYRFEILMLFVMGSLLFGTLTWDQAIQAMIAMGEAP